MVRWSAHGSHMVRTIARQTMQVHIVSKSAAHVRRMISTWSPYGQRMTSTWPAQCHGKRRNCTKHRPSIRAVTKLIVPTKSQGDSSANLCEQIISRGLKLIIIMDSRQCFPPSTREGLCNTHLKSRVWALKPTPFFSMWSPVNMSPDRVVQMQ